MNNNFEMAEAVADVQMDKKDGFKEWLQFQKKEFIKNINITKQLVLRSIKVQYRNSVIGVFWTVLNPLLNMLVMYLVFSSIFGRGGSTTPTDRDTYALYLLCGNIVFGMMRTATYQSLPSLVQNRGLLTKNKMSYNVFPLSHNLSALINFGFSFIALLGVMVVSLFQKQAVFSTNIFLVLVMLPALFLFTYGLSLILCAMYTFFRDIMHFYNVFLTLWMYLTPIFYQTNVFDSQNGTAIFSSANFMKVIIKLNPMYYFVEYFRDVVYRCSAHQAAVSIAEANGEVVTEMMRQAAQLPTFWDTALLYIIGICATLLGATVFLATKRKFIYNI